jgi:hypothetical protein
MTLMMRDETKIIAILSTAKKTRQKYKSYLNIDLT